MRIAMYEDKLHAALTVNPHALEVADERDRERAQDSRAAARHPGCAQRQHPHHGHADDRRRAGVRRAHSAVRSDVDEKPARRGRDHHREDWAHRAGELGGGCPDADARQLQRGRRSGLQSVRSAERSPRGDVRRPSRADHRRVELGRGYGGQLLGGERRQRDVGIDTEPGESKHARRHQTDRRPHQPLRRDSDHRRSGHCGPDCEERERRRDHAWRPRERRARSERSGDAGVHAAAEPRLHQVSEARGPEGRAHRHPARVLL